MIERRTVLKKDGREVYTDGRKSYWGDLWPLERELGGRKSVRRDWRERVVEWKGPGGKVENDSEESGSDISDSDSDSEGDKGKRRT